LSRLLRSSALALLFATVLPQAPADLFIYASAQAADPTIPSWVAASCCGPSDARRLRADQVYDQGDYYVVDGYNEPIPKRYANTPNNAIRPSQDGDYWIFYSSHEAGWTGSPEGGHWWQNAAQSGVYCFFVPMDF
jgi:hypothetical protein